MSRPSRQSRDKRREATKAQGGIRQYLAIFNLRNSHKTQIKEQESGEATINGKRAAGVTTNHKINKNQKQSSSSATDLCVKQTKLCLSGLILKIPKYKGAITDNSCVFYT